MRVSHPAVDSHRIQPLTTLRLTLLHAHSPSSRLDNTSLHTVPPYFNSPHLTPLCYDANCAGPPREGHRRRSIHPCQSPCAHTPTLRRLYLLPPMLAPLQLAVNLGNVNRSTGRDFGEVPEEEEGESMARAAELSTPVSAFSHPTLHLPVRDTQSQRGKNQQYPKSDQKIALMITTFHLT